MDPVSVVLTALVVGAAAVLKTTTEEVVKDAYKHLKHLITQKFGKVADEVDEVLEAEPSSKARQALLRESLVRLRVADDAEITAAANRLISLAQIHAPGEFTNAGIDLQAVEGGSLTVEDISAEGTGVRIRDAKVRGAIKISRVDARPSNDQSHPS